METPNPRTARRHDLDWLRFIAILILLFFHTGMLFNPWGWHIKNAETSESFRYWMIWFHEWRMPLLLFISGAGTYMALGKRTPRQYLGERFKRLFVPLVVGIFVVVPPQIYFEHKADYANYIEFYKTIFQFVPYPEGSFSWHHLWFIAYLLVYSLLALPLLVVLRSRRSEILQGRVMRWLCTPAGILVIPSLIILTTQILLRPYFPDETHAFANDWAYFTFYFCFFVAGMVFYSNETLWRSVRENRGFLLTAALFILVPFYLSYFHLHDLMALPWPDDAVETVFDVTAIFLSWFTVITVIAYGQEYLNIQRPWLRHVNEGLYPFYILHQTVIIVIGYYLCQLPWSISAKFWAVSALTLLSCMAIYFSLIRPFNVTRVLFGMKSKKKQHKKSALAAAVTDN